MNIFTFYYFILTFARINAYSKIPTNVEMEINNEYIYSNVIELDTWESANSNTSNIVKEYYKFKTYLYPTSINEERGYEVWKINEISDSKTINPFFSEEENLYPSKIFIPLSNKFLKPIGDKYVLIKDKYLLEKEKYKSSDTIILADLNTKKIINSLNVITKTDQEPFDLKFMDVFIIKTASNIDFTGNISGKGKEESLKTYFLKNFVLYKDKTTFEYEYEKGIGKKRKKYVSKGNKYTFIDSINKVEVDTFYIENDVDNFSNIRYFVDENGIFLPISINNTKKTNAYLRPSSEKSYVLNNYFLNVFKTFKYYFFSPNVLKINKTSIYNPIIFLSSNVDNNYKVPIVIGSDILSQGLIYLNDKKRLIRFVVPTSSEVPKEAVICAKVGGDLLFDVSVNSNNTKAIISFSEPKTIISKDLVSALKIKTKKLGLSLDKPESIKEKVELIISTPFDKTYKKTNAYLKDLSNKEYKIIIGLDYLKRKELSIDFVNKWILIK